MLAATCFRYHSERFGTLTAARVTCSLDQGESAFYAALVDLAAPLLEAYEHAIEPESRVRLAKVGLGGASELKSLSTLRSFKSSV